ncbi:right-handed parallel beta-helix repeat-containing protein [Novipirellula artificiosorum]|nr:right-handed parallel beta-helix repeat-containing protein [Novipirellula artificiosorum]
MIRSLCIGLCIASFVPMLSPCLANTFVVATTGSDDAKGTASAPVRTISRAAEMAMPGDTVLVRAGIYRERVSPPRGGQPGKPITYRAEQWGRVLIKGSDLWQPTWTEHADGVYFAVPEESVFTDDVYLDSANPFRVEMASTPYNRNGKPEKDRFGYGDPKLVYNCGQIIVGDELFEQKPFLDEVELQADSWTFDSDSGRIYVHFGDRIPSQSVVEITTRRRIFAPHRLGLGHIVVEGFVLEHCGNNYPTNFWSTPIWAQSGALGLRGGHHWIVRNNMIRYANTVAIDVGFKGGSNEPAPEIETDQDSLGTSNRIEANYLVDNGAAGLIGSGSIEMVVCDNVIMRNNTLGFIGNKRYEHAGIKCHDIRDGRIERNYIANNPLNDGVWLDNRFPGTRISRNLIVNNGVKGIFLEMSDQDWDSAFVDHNIVIGNTLNQFYVHDASGSTVIHNLFANSPTESRNGQGAYIYQVTSRTRTYHHSLFNNLFVNHRVIMDINYPSHLSGPQRLDHNVYDASADQRAFIVNSASDKPSPWNPAEFIALVDQDLGHLSTGEASIDDGKKAKLTFDQWQAFWQSHGLANDQHSVLTQGISVSYKPQTHELTLFVPLNPDQVGSNDHPSIDEDYWGSPIAPNGHARPGPFQNLKQGENVFCVWRGLPVLDRGAVPQSSMLP